jgi:hypothetical protein
MPDNLPKTPKPDIQRPQPKTIKVDWLHPGRQDRSLADEDASTRGK